MSRGGLERTFADGADLRLRLGDRAVCRYRNGNRYRAVMFERVVDNPRSLAPRVGRSLVYGIAPRGTQDVLLTVRDATMRATLDRRTRAFLAVLPPEVRRTDLVIRIDGRPRRKVIDLTRTDTSDYGLFHPESVLTELTTRSPVGGPPLALQSYEFTATADDTWRCFEPGRVVEGEVGLMHPRFGSFAEGPAPEEFGVFEDSWLPNAVPAFRTGNCTNRPLAVGRFPVISAKRFSSRLVVVHGVLSQRAVALAAKGHRALPRKAVLAPSGAFLVPVLSRGKLGEAARLTARLRNGKRWSTTIALGAQDRPTRWSTWSEGSDATTLLIRWTGGPPPPVRAEINEAERRLSVRILERYPPDFGPDGLRLLIAGVGISRCVKVRLRSPLSGRAVFDATARRQRPRDPESSLVNFGQRCIRVRTRHLR